MRADRSDLLRAFPFAPDRFQLDAFDAVDAGRHVVVAAPTGSGKTVVAEYAIATELGGGRRSFYTAPIKALSNQKYNDLVELHGDDAVGLLTGDNSINGDAPIVVMTTEVLRNMIYAGRRLDDLGVVVLDEVHYLQDAYRGPVWEEVIIHLPSHVQLVCLSATVSNVQELADWITTVRGPTSSVVELTRPVRLENRYFVADRTNDRLHFLPMFVGGQPNRDALRLDESAVRRPITRGVDRSRQGRRRRETSKGSGQRKLVTPGRLETLHQLDRRGLLPAIYFIFSRAQCDEAAASCLDAGIALTTAAERASIGEIVDARLSDLDPHDLDVLGYARFVAQLDCGVAAHHAGMLPAMKEVVEACFVAGLIKVVFATETLALGINMPARSVVIEKLSKFTGDHHERLTPGEYTQLTGRAGRRGIDEVGDAVVLWSPWVPFADVAQLASSTSFPLRSAFRPTYNMAANLIRTHTSDEAHRLLSLSFAQYQADRDVVRIEARLERRRERLAELRAAATSPYGDLDEYRRRRADETAAERRARAASAGEMRGSLARLRPGRIIRIAKGTYKGPAVVVATAHRKAGVKLSLVTRSGALIKATAEDFDVPPEAVGAVTMPRHFSPQSKDSRNDVAKRLRQADIRRDRRPPDTVPETDRRGPRSDELDVARDPDLRQRLDAAGQADRVEREIDELGDRVARKHQSLSQDFDRVLSMLDRFGYVELDDWVLTRPGATLAGVFHECDLLVAEILHRGVLDDLSPADVAALVSCVVYEHRSPEPSPAPWFSTKQVAARWRKLEAISDDIRANERSLGLAEHRSPDPTFAAIAHAWVVGESFGDIVAEEDVTGGDFVRTMKQLVDLLSQVATVAPSADTRDAARHAAKGAFRGVVADSSIVT